MTEKRFKVAVYDENAINGFAVLDLHKPNISKRLKYENVYVGSKEGCEIVCKFGNGLADENEQLKAQLYCPFDSICTQCDNEYLVQKEYYYVSKCKKGHEQCSKVDVKYCDDFEVKELQE